MSSSPHPMNDGTPAAGGIFARLPRRLQPLSEETASGGRRQRIEAAVLLALALVLAVASIYDVTRQARINYRLTADIATWQEVTQHDFKELDVEQNLTTYTNRDIVCGNTTFGKPGTKQQVCLVMKGAIVKGRREATGGFFLAPEKPDRPHYRYGCFGAAAKERLCTVPVPSGESTPVPKAFAS